jgi:hypothetical protein
MLLIARPGIFDLQVEDGGVPSDHIDASVDADEVSEVIERMAVLRFP